MIYRSDRLTLRSVMDVFQGKVNDIMICEELSGSRKCYYTLLAVKDHETVKKLLQILKRQEGKESCVEDLFSFQNELCLVFPYIKERKLAEFYMAKAMPLAKCEKICMNLLLQCMASPLPYPLLELVLKQGQIHLRKDNSIALGYCLDLTELNENCTEKECAMRCAVQIRELLQDKSSKKNISYQLLLKKIPRQSYRTFRELYKDLKLSTEREEKLSPREWVADTWRRHQAGILRFLLKLSVVLAVLVLILFLSHVIWGELPFLRLFVNTFKQIGTESLTQ